MANTVHHSLIANLRANTSSFEKGMKRAGSSLSGFGNRAKAVGGFAVKSFAVMGAAAVGAGVALSFPIKSAMKSIDDIAKMSAELDISTEALSGLEHAANITGASLPTLHKGLQIMVRKLGEAKEGIGTAKQGLDKLGLSVNDMAGMGAEEQFTTLADRISKLPTASEKAQAAFSIFGRQGMEMLNTLNLGSEGLAELRKEAEELGITFSKFDAAQVEAANDSITRLKGLISGVVNSLAIALAPYIQYVSDYFISLGKKAGGATQFISDKMIYLVKIIGWAVKGINLLKSAFNFVAGAIYKGIEWIMVGFEKLFNLMAKGAELLKMEGLADSLRTAGTFSEAFAEGFNELASDKCSKAGEQFSKAFSEDTAKNVLDQIQKNKAEIKLSLGKTPLSGEEFEIVTGTDKKSGKASAMEFRSRYIDVKALSKGGMQSPEEKAIKEDVAANRQTAQNTAKMLSAIAHLALA